jgi:hypothetical protein
MLTMLTALTLSAAPSGLALLLVERGGNFEPQGNDFSALQKRPTSAL